MKELIMLEVPQFELLTASKFVRYLRSRDIRINEEELEYFEKEGFIYPVLRLKRPVIKEGHKASYGSVMTSTFYLKEYLKDNLLEFPNSSNFRPWREYRDENGEENTIIFYHPYQVFILNRFINFTRITVKSSYIETATRYEEMFQQVKMIFRQVKEAFLSARPKLIRQIGLLLQLQNAYQPYYRGILHLTWDENSAELWKNWRKNIFSLQKVLEDSEMSIEEVKKLRDYFAVQGHFIDPLAHWYPLIRLIPYRKKEKLKGKALLAQDYYEVVGLLNMFLKDLTGEEQPEPDDVVDGRGGRWKNAYYGMKFDYRNEELRRKIVSEYLYVTIPKVFLLVEGSSEETAIKILFEAFGKVPEQEGIYIYNFEGLGTDRVIALLKAAKQQSVGRYLIIDNDKGAEELVKEAVERRKLLDDDCYRIWKRDFEYDNFGVDSVIETVNTQLSANGLKPLQKSEIEQRLINKPEEKLWKAIADICYLKNSFPLDSVMSKTELARTLSIGRAEEIRQEIASDSYKPKWRIEEDIIKVHKKFCR
jgi:hypothetical protein